MDATCPSLQRETTQYLLIASPCLGPLGASLRGERRSGGRGCSRTRQPGRRRGQGTRSLGLQPQRETEKNCSENRRAPSNPVGDVKGDVGGSDHLSHRAFSALFAVFQQIQRKR